MNIITRQVVSDKILDFLNHDITLAEIVDWAERTFIDCELLPEDDIDLLHDILMYLAGADTGLFPLTVEVCFQFLERLGVEIAIIRKN